MASYVLDVLRGKQELGRSNASVATTSGLTVEECALKGRDNCTNAKDELLHDLSQKLADALSRVHELKCENDQLRVIASHSAPQFHGSRLVPPRLSTHGCAFDGRLPSQRFDDIKRLLIFLAAHTNFMSRTLVNIQGTIILHGVRITLGRHWRYSLSGVGADELFLSVPESFADDLVALLTAVKTSGTPPADVVGNLAKDWFVVFDHNDSAGTELYAVDEVHHRAITIGDWPSRQQHDDDDIRSSRWDQIEQRLNAAEAQVSARKQAAAVDDAARFLKFLGRHLECGTSAERVRFSAPNCTVVTSKRHVLGRSCRMRLNRQGIDRLYLTVPAPQVDVVLAWADTARQSSRSISATADNDLTQLAQDIVSAGWTMEGLGQTDVANQDGPSADQVRFFVVNDKLGSLLMVDSWPDDEFLGL